MNRVKTIISMLLIFAASISFASEYKGIYDTLRTILPQRESYFNEQMKAIETWRSKLLETTDLRERFEICYETFSLSRSFKYEIANRYSSEAYNIAQQIGDKDLIHRAIAAKISTLTSGGLFAEAVDLIKEIDIEGVDEQVRRRLYYNIIRHYSDRCDYAGESEFQSVYSGKIRMYADSVMRLSIDRDYYYTYAKAYSEVHSNRSEDAINTLREFYGSNSASEHHNAIISYTLSTEYFKMGREADGLRYVLASVGHDIRSAARENCSIKSLSKELYANGEESMAEQLINIAYEDATFYNARHRNLEINTLLPIINLDTITTIRSHRKMLYIFLFVVSLLSLIALLFWIIAHRRATELKASKSIIERQLGELIEANSIKEHYIIESIHKKSESMEIIAALLKKIDIKVKHKQYDDLRYIYKDFNIKRERENFFADFDKAFLKLFPTFIEEYNELFAAEDRVTLSGEEIELPAELRIFALIRLGITENEQIAKFLNLSINTVYTYKTKVKSKTIIPKDEFESHLHQIGSHQIN